MSKPGPKALPENVKALYGNRGKRQMKNKDVTVAPLEKPPRPPANLGEVAKKEWRRMSKELCAHRRLAAIDLSALAAYCCAFELWQDAYGTILAEGSTILTDKKNRVQHPSLSIANRQQAEMRKWLKELGATPACRPAPQAPEVDADNPAEKFFK